MLIHRQCWESRQCFLELKSSSGQRLQPARERPCWLSTPRPIRDRIAIGVTAVGQSGRIGALHHQSASILEESCATGWHPLEQPLIWQGSEEDAMQGLPQSLNAPWKVILLSDGSVTRHLRLMTGHDVKVVLYSLASMPMSADDIRQSFEDCLEMRTLPEGASDLPAGVEEIPGPHLQRQVLLRQPAQPDKVRSSPGASLPLVYAASWWNAEEAKSKLAKAEQPIWTSLLGTELRREIQRVCLGNSPYLEQKLGVKGPFWGRQYVFYWNGGTPLTVIYEVFSPKLEQYLGPMMN